MHKLLTKYGLAAHLAILAVAPLFLSPTAVINLSALAALWLLMEPSRIGREMLHSARQRVWKNISKDPLFWVMAGILVFAGIRCLNSGVSMAYDAELSKWLVSAPKIPILPGSVEGCGYDEFAAVAALAVLLQGIRHGLGRSARGAFMLLSSALSGAVALTMALDISNPSALAFRAVKCDIADPSFIGAVFGVYLALAVCALAVAQRHKWYSALPLAMFCVGANATGLFLFSPSAVSVLYAAVALIAAIYSFIYARMSIGAPAEFKYFVFFAMPVAITLVLVVLAVDPNVVEARSAAYVTGEFRPEQFDEVRDITSSIAAKVWKENPWLGSGLGSFSLDLKYHALPTDWMIISPVQNAPLNGYWMLLAERGVVGAFVLSVPVVLLVIFYFIRLFRSFAAGIPEPAASIAVPLLLAVSAEALVDVTYLTPAMLAAVAASLAISAGSFPKENKNGK